ncbi:MAG TPA: ABC transporter ATP-binding protein [Acidimicrobiales bacterium]|nr:ABC transporter ATP-binding protein [Acidimicrobiales bacterium]
MNEILRTEGLSVSFGGVHAVRDVSVRVAEGQLVGLIGPNGAGKTTFIDALTGFVRSRGRVVFDGRDISGWPAHRCAHVGLLRTWQSTEIFTDLTVSENLIIGTERESLGRVLLDLVAPGRRRPVADVHDVLKRFDLDDLAERMPSDLSAGQRKLVGVARALAAGPRLVLMDEPAAGLDSEESLELGRHLRGVIDDGISILLIDHDMGLVLSVCDYLYVLDAGKLIAQGTPAEIRRNEEVLAAYLGETEENAALDGEVSR